MWRCLSGGHQLQKNTARAGTHCRAQPGQTAGYHPFDAALPVQMPHLNIATHGTDDNAIIVTNGGHLQS